MWGGVDTRTWAYFFHLLVGLEGQCCRIRTILSWLRQATCSKFPINALKKITRNESNGLPRQE